MLFMSKKKLKERQEELMDTLIIPLIFKEETGFVSDDNNGYFVTKFGPMEKGSMELDLISKNSVKEFIFSGAIDFLEVSNGTYKLHTKKFLDRCYKFKAENIDIDYNKSIAKYSFNVRYADIDFKFTIFEFEMYTLIQNHLINTALDAIYKNTVK